MPNAGHARSRVGVAPTGSPRHLPSAAGGRVPRARGRRRRPPPRSTRSAAKRDTVAWRALAERECAREAAPHSRPATRIISSSWPAATGCTWRSARWRRSRPAHPDIQRDGHGYTHVIGIRAWHAGADVAAIFRSCTGLFQSGCYHGVIQAYLTEGGHRRFGARRCSSATRSRRAKPIAGSAFSASTASGHGFEMAWNWELPHALKGCDWLHSAWDRYSCYGGVFMENAVASMPGGTSHRGARARPRRCRRESIDGDGMAMAGMDT